jgi:hypothetical protein
MPRSRMLRRAALVRTDVSDNLIVSIIREKRISTLQVLVTANVVPSTLILITLIMEAICSSKMSALTRARRRHIPEDDILQHALLTIYSK